MAPRRGPRSDAELKAEGLRGRAPGALELSAWMIAYQAGEMSAFERLYHRLAPKVRKYLISLTLSVPRAEDLLQETFLQIHRSRHTYAAPRPVEPWAFGVARHVYLMDCRAWARRRRLEVESDEELPDLPVPSASEGSEDRAVLRRAVAGLPAERREPLLLHHVWGFSFQEIAGMLGIREGAAKVRAHRARKQLQALLADSFEGSNPDREASQGKAEGSRQRPPRGEATGYQES